MSEPDWDDLIARALAGELAALEGIVRGLQDRVYALALRFLWTPQDAEDATQEILIRIVTRLDRFEGRSKFTTWAHRVAVNHLLDSKASRAEQARVSFEALDHELVAIRPSRDLERDVDFARQRARVELACLHGMLLGLDRDQRMALLLGVVLELEGPDAAALLDISPARYRKRLSRAKQRLGEFMQRRCGLVDEAAACRCEHWVGQADANRRLAPYLEVGAALERSGEHERLAEVYGDELAAIDRIARLYRRRDLQAPQRVLAEIMQIMQTLGGRELALLRN
ncbi:RNA polymerase sigma factor [Nannocystaceae bacterium ST9]